MTDICNKLFVAKTSAETDHWLPLYMHHLDAYYVMQHLLDEFVSASIAESCGMDLELFRNTALFCSLVHDIGKASVGFQYKIAFNAADRAEILKKHLDIPDSMDMRKIQSLPHAYAGEAVLKYYGCPESIAVIVGSHHGVPADSGYTYDLTCDRRDIIGYRNYYGDTEENRSTLETSWHNIILDALDRSGFGSVDDLPVINSQAQMLISGLLITADWIASNNRYFPLLEVDDDGENVNSEERSRIAWENIGFTERWNSDRNTYNENDFKTTFGFLPRAVQKRMIEIVENTSKPGLFILEAPMGSGKTEAALACAELVAAKCKKSGLFFGMPTQATTNGIFPRIMDWAEKQSGEYYHSVVLKHGSSELNETFQKIQKGIPEDDSDSGLVVHSWFCDSKKACLADFVAATVDRMLMLALKRRHVMLLHLGLAEKVVIIDEVHAYDAYMSRYLERALQWLGAYNTPVILLSATLPSKRRMSLVRAYLGKKRSDEIFEKNIAYPLLTWTDNRELMQEPLPQDAEKKIVHISKCTDKDLLDIVNKAVGSGGCVGIIMNTVNRAQSTAKLICGKITDNVLLYHAQYTMQDRTKKENKLLQKIGRNDTQDDRRGLVVIGTQVLEQSLDIDFDLLITDICPIDLLLQRIGRLHRHIHDRPDDLKMPVCRVLTDEYENEKSGSQMIYGTWLLKETLNIIPDTVTLPDDISVLVQAVYNSFDESEEYLNYKNKNDISVSKAEAFLLQKPKRKDIYGLLDRSVNDDQAEASVRDGADSIEVLAMKLYSDGTIGFLDNTMLSGELTYKDTEEIAKQRLKLPIRLANKWNIDKTINELENNSKPYISAWKKEPLLRGKLVLFFDENNEAHLSGYKLKYDHTYGLIYEKE